MTDRHIVARALHDIGLATWFGGTLFGAVSLNAASATVSAATERTRVANVGWLRFWPVQAAGTAAYLAGAARITQTDAYRLAKQKGVTASSWTKTGVTAAALGASAYAGVLGQQVMRAGDVPAESGVEPTPATPEKTASAMRQLKIVQWVVPALVGGIWLTTAWQAEQQRPGQVFAGLLER
jgi:hypothetical protein